MVSPCVPILPLLQAAGTESALLHASVAAATRCIAWHFDSPPSLAAEHQAGSPHPCSFCVAKNKYKGPLPFESLKKY